MEEGNAVEREEEEEEEETISLSSVSKKASMRFVETIASTRDAVTYDMTD